MPQYVLSILSLECFRRA